jgi:hypothetical protein
MAKTEQPDQRTPSPVTGSRPTTGTTAGETRPAEAKAEDTGLEQIREILFGSVHRELERRLVRADAHLLTRGHELEQETRRRTEVLETHLKKETEALAARLDRELAENSDTLRKLTREYRDAIANLEQKVGKLEESSAQAQREIRRQLLDQAKSFLDELQQLRKELVATLQQELRMAEGERIGESYGAEEHPGH